MSRFGTVPITLIRRNSDASTEWTPDYRSVTFHFPGGNLNETQTFGQAPLQLQATVRLQDEATFTQFMALMHTRQTLRQDYHATAFAGDIEGQEHGELYKDFLSVFATNPTGIRRRMGGQVELDVTFQREPPS